MDQEWKLKVGVKILLENKDGKFLFLRKNGALMELSDYWEIPGGKIDPGFTLKENLKREIKEETQIDFDGDAELLDVVDIIRPHRGLHAVRLFFRAKVDTVPAVQIDTEHLEYKWASIEEMRNDPETEEFVKKVLDKHYA